MQATVIHQSCAAGTTVAHLHFSGGTPATQFLKKSRWYDSASAGCFKLHTEREV